MEFTTEALIGVKAHEHLVTRSPERGTLTIFVLPENLEIEFPESDLYGLPLRHMREEFVAGKIRTALDRRANGNIFHPRRHEMRNFG